MAGDAINVLWTAGWDSTFRVLWLSLKERASVQPYYILKSKADPTTAQLMELYAMRRIRLALRKKDPDAAALIRPGIFFAKHDIRPDATMTARYRQLRKKAFLGQQIQWLARFSDQAQLDHLELCVHHDDNAYKFIKDYIQPNSLEGARRGWVLAPNAPDELMLYRRFRFPLLDMTKVKMGVIAKENDFDHIMRLTWFCHAPWRGLPCGICNPCKYAEHEGMGWRIPRISRVRRRLMPLLSLVQSVENRMFRISYKLLK
jgi:hypothetical protein